MNWIPHVTSGSFALAGLLLAAGPVLIHLLNRRRFRVVDWAAMEFLLEALHRQKRRMQLRDLLLLLVRVAAVFCFAMALARPYFTSRGGPVGADSPRHLILLLDNSLSMGYRSVDTSMLDQAKRQASRLIEAIPDGSQVSLVPTSGRQDVYRGPIRRKSDALELLARVPLVDGTSSIEDVLAAARAAIGSATPLADQVVFFTDLQRRNWPSDVEMNLVKELPLLQIRDLSTGSVDNAWVADVRLRDDVVDLDTPATVFATIRHFGPTLRRTQVTLAVNGQAVASRSVELSAGQSERQVAFECSFSDAPVEPGNVSFVPLQVSLTPDRLEEDDQRTIMVPVVTSLPVVFVDQFADDAENSALGQLGETRPLRHLLAPRTTDKHRPLIDAQHVTIADVTQSTLAPARLVVIAGVADPSPAIELLWQYVQQGGPLVIAAGGQFDPRAWNQAAGPQGVDLLPGLLADQPLGIAPDEVGDGLLQPWYLSFESLSSQPLLRLPGLSEDELREIYGEPLFFKFIPIQPGPRGLAPGEARGAGSPILPQPATWLQWKSPRTSPEVIEPETARTGNWKEHGQVCAHFTDPLSTPFLVRQRLGKGEVLFVSTSILPTWNNLAQTNAMVFWDHILRTLIRSTLPQRNFSAREQLSLPVPLSQRGALVQLQRPQSTRSAEVLDVGFIEKDQQGVTIPGMWSRGVYRLSTIDRPEANAPTATRNWQLEIAVNGDASESDLSPLSQDEVLAHVVDTGLGQLVTNNGLAALPRATQGNTIWWWLALSVLILLLGEMFVLAWSSRGRRTAVLE